MIAASLILAALVSAPLATRSVVPLSSAGVSAVATPAAFNPQATARAHIATVTVTPTVSGTLSVAVESEAGVPIATLASGMPVTAAAPVEVTWDGAGAADGAYAVRATVVDAQGAVSEAVAPVLIDTQPPRVTLPPVTPSATARGPVDVRAGVADPSGVTAMTLDVASQTGVAIGSTPLQLGADGLGGSTTWNLRIRKRLLLPGVFHLSVRATDGAGNAGSSTVRLLRVQRAVTPKVIYSLPDAGNAIGLSFDDCVEGADVLRIVKAFRAAKARTTFFCNGVNVASNPSAMRAIVAGGNAIGTHTWSHKELPRYPQAVQASEMQGDADAWWSVARAAPNPLLRPPYGLWNQTTLRAAGQRGYAWVVLWNVDPSDYLDPAPSVLIQKVVADARPGAIVVMHANANTAGVVPDLIRALRAKGLEPKSIDEMLGPAAYLSPASG